jgi:thiosulfate/3-mercaptopyruvate sulfurtransferase
MKWVRVVAFVWSIGLIGDAGVPTAWAEPWRPSETLEPFELSAMLARGSKPSIVYVGPRALFRVGRIPGAVFHGPASEPEALRELKHWARSLPPSGMLVLYCGCCPLEKCPNIRPAFEALGRVALTNVRVLLLKTSFEKDWVDKGLPVEK